MSGTFGDTIALLGVLLFGLTAVFALVTLPVEFNAHRTQAATGHHGHLVAQELAGVNKVLDAAALTYVAAAVQAVTTMIYYLMILGRRHELNPGALAGLTQRRQDAKNGHPTFASWRLCVSQNSDAQA